MEWRTVVYKDEVFEDYEVSRDGEHIRNKTTKRELKLRDNLYGYYVVGLHKNKKQYTLKVHRIVAYTYSDLIPNDNPTEKTDINHINENKHDNSVENLEWTTHGNNIVYSQAKRVRCIDTGQEFESVNELCRVLGLDVGCVSQVCLGKRKSHKNLHFEYVD